MASDFYKRTQHLFEEFQKRELQYLNAETATRSHFQVTNMPVHEYLEKLNEREKETEEAYLGLMRHMEQLDNRTESITDKLRKLETLRMSMNSKTSVWPYSTHTKSDRSLYNYTSSNVLSDETFTNNYSHSHPDQYLLLSQKKVVDCASTQTDIIFCENCQFPINVFTEKQHDSFLTKNTSVTALPSFQNASLSSHFVENETAFKTTLPFQDIISKEEGVSDLNKVEKLPLITPNLPKIPEEVSVQNEASLNQTLPTDNLLSITPNIKPPESTTNNILKTDILATSDFIENVIEEKLTEKDNILNSMSRENDSNIPSNVASEVFDHSEIIKDSDLTTSIVIDDLSTLSVNQKVYSEGEISTSKINVKETISNQDGLSDKRSESPISIGGAPSPSLYSENISAVSDSDSFDGKEHLKESAAYQALLGIVPVNKKAQKTVTTYSESESEDEVERALANVARKSSSIPTTTVVQEEKPNESRKSDAIEEPKAKNEPRKSISLTKSQQLSKSTRKVLGLDTSSGSEGEIRIEAKPSQKIEEDSDEFDFYD